MLDLVYNASDLAFIKKWSRELKERKKQKKKRG